MSAPPLVVRRGAGAFTLVELLVVLGILAILMAILIPTLAGVREQSKYTHCLSNLRQIGIAFLAYEADHGRFPPHPYEAGDWGTFPASIKGPTFDTRELLKSYMSVDRFVCPGVAEWKPSESKAAIINIDYVLTPGYYSDATLTDVNDPKTAVFSKKFWVKPGAPWKYGPYAMNVIAGDKVYLDPVSLPGTNRHVVNHPERKGKYAEWQPPGFAGTAWLALYPAGEDHRLRLKANFVFADGSARTVGPNAGGELVRVPVRNAARLGTDYLLPVRP